MQSLGQGQRGPKSPAANPTGERGCGRGPPCKGLPLPPPLDFCPAPPVIGLKMMNAFTSLHTIRGFQNTDLHGTVVVSEFYLLFFSSTDVITVVLYSQCLLKFLCISFLLTSEIVKLSFYLNYFPSV